MDPLKEISDIFGIPLQPSKKENQDSSDAYSDDGSGNDIPFSECQKDVRDIIQSSSDVASSPQLAQPKEEPEIEPAIETKQQETQSIKESIKATVDSVKAEHETPQAEAAPLFEDWLDEPESPKAEIVEAVVCKATSDEDDLFDSPIAEKVASDVVDTSKETDEHPKENLQKVEEKVKEELVVSDNSNVEEVEKDNTVKQSQTDTNDKLIDKAKTFGASTKGNFEWLLQSPSSKFDDFYYRKSSLLEEITPGGLIPFKSWRQELIESSVNVSVPIYAIEEIHARMQKVQDLKNRVAEIRIRVNAQYFLWERAVTLLQGLLARVEYDKPAVKFDGLILEHMWDMERYHSELRSIHNSAEMVFKTLDSAFECLSRQVTIALPGKPIRRFAPTDTQEYEVSRGKNSCGADEKETVVMEGFDTLSERAEAKREVKGKATQEIEWGNI